MRKKYYEAYDERYKQVHEHNLQWFSTEPSPIVAEVVEDFSVQKSDKILEIGCGEGRDAYFLLENGFDLLASDISDEAISFCKKNFPKYSDNFTKINCITDKLEEKFDFIFAVAVVHMLVLDEDRRAFYNFIKNHLKSSGIALVCTMGDGTQVRQTDINLAFELQNRVHEQSGKSLELVSTSCRMVDFEQFHKELFESNFQILKEGITSVEPDFPQMMFAVIKAQN